MKRKQYTAPAQKVLSLSEENEICLVAASGTTDDPTMLIKGCRWDLDEVLNDESSAIKDVEVWKEW